MFLFDLLNLRFSFSLGDCISYDYVLGSEFCDGANSCMLRYASVPLSDCDQQQRSNYISIDYDCVPDLTETENLCGLFTANKQGALTSPSWPNFDANQTNCVARIAVDPSMVVKAYVTDLNIDTE